MSIMGTRVIRTEDPRLLTAGAVYVDDLRTPELNAAPRATFVRSPLAHARITGIDTSEALSKPGVVAVLTVHDMDDLDPPPPDSGEWDHGPIPQGGPWAESLLATDTVRFVGEPVAIVITDGSSRDGRILAYRLDVIQDSGAYSRTGGFLPSMTKLMASGVYDIPEVQAGFRVAVTNTTPIFAYRGAGRPEAAAAIERAVDLFAAEIGMDPAEVRRRNFVAGHASGGSLIADDAGRILNPVLTEGQRHGGIAQGAGQALLEEVLYDADGNPLTSTLADYAAISPPDLPSFELLTSETPTDLNPLGAKGIGEAGTIGSTPTIQNAVVDAVAHLGVRHIDMPATPQRVWTAINAVPNSAQSAGQKGE